MLLMTTSNKGRAMRFISLCLMLMSSALFADPLVSPEKLLDRMSHSFRELNYEGTFSYQQGSTMESLRVIHAVFDGEEYEKLEYLDGGRREIVRRGHQLDCIHPGHQLIRFFQQQQSIRNSALSQPGIGDIYRFTVTGEDRVAGRKVINLEVSPRDTHRFGYRLSLDSETGLLLRTELIGDSKAVIERFQFASITIGEVISKSHFMGVESDAVADSKRHSSESSTQSYSANHIEPAIDETQGNTVSKNSWVVRWLPTGFTSAIANLKVVSNDMATFTDGLTVFSVFLERDVDANEMQRGLEGSAQKGATTAYSRALYLAGQPHRVTVVGEIPPQTAQQIARSVALVRP